MFYNQTQTNKYISAHFIAPHVHFVFYIFYAQTNPPKNSTFISFKFTKAQVMRDASTANTTHTHTCAQVIYLYLNYCPPLLSQDPTCTIYVYTNATTQTTIVSNKTRRVRCDPQPTSIKVIYLKKCLSSA